MTLAPVSFRCGIYPLTEEDRPAYHAHLLSLDNAARRLRFGVSLSDASLLQVAQKMPLGPDGLGLFMKGALVGCVQVLPLPKPGHAELAVSLSPEMRGRGWGAVLVSAALERARDQRKTHVEIFYLRANDAMHRIASSLPGPLSSHAQECHKQVTLGYEFVSLDDQLNMAKASLFEPFQVSDY